MELNTYQKFARATAIYPNLGANLEYVALGLGGEVGEVLNKVKKIQRDCGGKLTNDIKNAIVQELGGVLWYVAAMTSELKLDLEDIARANLKELEIRAEEGTLKGSGDNR